MENIRNNRLFAQWTAARQSPDAANWANATEKLFEAESALRNKGQTDQLDQFYQKLSESLGTPQAKGETSETTELGSFIIAQVSGMNASPDTQRALNCFLNLYQDATAASSTSDHAKRFCELVDPILKAASSRIITTIANRYDIQESPQEAKQASLLDTLSNIFKTASSYFIATTANADDVQESPQGAKQSPLLHLLKNNNPAAARMCIIAGVADINACDAEGNTALLFATWRDRHDIAKLLLQYGADPKITKNGWSPLFYAMYSDPPDIELVQSLLENGAEVNGKNPHGDTALLLATWKGHHDIAKLLLQHGADPKFTDRRGYSLLYWAVVSDSPEIVQLLVDHGASASIIHLDPHGYTPYCVAKQIRAEHYRDIRKIFKETLKSQQITPPPPIHATKLVGHALNLEGESETGASEEEAKLLISLESATAPQGWFHRMAKTTENFQRNNQQIIDEISADQLECLLEYAADTKQLDSATIAERIQKGLPTPVTTGFLRHVVTPLFWGDYFFLCNIGAESRAPIEAYHIDRSRCTENLIKEMRKVAQKGSDKDYIDLRQKMMETLAAREDLFSKLIAKGCKIPYQIVGNCSWASPVTAVWAAMIYDGVQRKLAELGIKESEIKEEHLEALREVVDEKNRCCWSWLSWQRISAIEYYLDKIETRGFEPDINLLRKAFRQIWMIEELGEPGAQKKLVMLEERFWRLLNTKSEYWSSKLPFFADRAYWKGLGRGEWTGDFRGLSIYQVLTEKASPLLKLARILK